MAEHPDIGIFLQLPVAHSGSSKTTKLQLTVPLVIKELILLNLRSVWTGGATPWR
jgi:hypothetical protein